MESDRDWRGCTKIKAVQQWVGTDGARRCGPSISSGASLLRRAPQFNPVFGGQLCDPTMTARIVAVSLLLGLVSLGQAPAPSSKPLRASDVQGCYTIALGPWNRPPEFDARFTTPPRAVNLTILRVKEFAQTRRYWVKPALGAKEGRLPIAIWYITPEGQVDITFSTGFIGVGLRLEPKGSALLGTATTFGDDNPGKYFSVAGARADRVACDARS